MQADPASARGPGSLESRPSVTLGQRVDWYYVKDGRSCGPIKAAELVRLHQEGTLKLQDLVWRPGLAQWQPLASIPGIARSNPSIPTAPAAPGPIPATAAHSVSATLPRASRVITQKATPVTRDGIMAYMMRHWRGEMPLRHSYWINTVGLSIPFGLAFAILGNIDFGDSHAFMAINILLILQALALITSVWQVVGTWRAASNHVRETGYSFWPRVTQGLLLLGSYVVTINLVAVYPMASELVKIAFHADGLNDYKVFASSNGTELHVNGSIGFALTDRVRQVHEQSPRTTTLVITSMGGRVSEAHVLRDYLQTAGITTVRAEDKCLSACTLVFMGGQHRILARNASLGFHRYSFPGLSDVFSRQVEKDKRYFISKGVSSEFVEKAYSTPNTSVWVPDTVTLFRSGVIESVQDGDRQLDLHDYALLHARELDDELQKLPLYSAIRSHAREEHASILGAMAKAVENGADDQSAVSQITRLVPKLVYRYVPRASDDAVSGYVTVMIQEMTQLQHKNPALCRAFLFPRAGQTVNIGEYISKETVQADMAALTLSIQTGATAPEPVPGFEEVRDILMPVYQSARAKYGDSISVLGDPAKSSLDDAQTCQAVIDIYTGIQQYANPQRARALRFMLASAS